MVLGSMDDFTYLAIEAITMLQYDVSMLQVRKAVKVITI